MKPIILSKKFKIEKDAYSWVLIFQEEREKVNAKTKELEKFIFEDKWYYPCIKMVLKKYIDLECKEAENFEEIISKIDALDLKIEQLKNTIFKT